MKLESKFADLTNLRILAGNVFLYRGMSFLCAGFPFPPLPWHAEWLILSRLHTLVTNNHICAYTGARDKAKQKCRVWAQLVNLLGTFSPLFLGERSPSFLWCLSACYLDTCRRSFRCVCLPTGGGNRCRMAYVVRYKYQMECLHLGESYIKYFKWLTRKHSFKGLRSVAVWCVSNVH